MSVEDSRDVRGNDDGTKTPGIDIIKLWLDAKSIPSSPVPDVESKLDSSSEDPEFLTFSPLAEFSNSGGSAYTASSIVEDTMPDNAGSDVGYSEGVDGTDSSDSDEPAMEPGAAGEFKVGDTVIYEAPLGRGIFPASAVVAGMTDTRLYLYIPGGETLIVQPFTVWDKRKFDQVFEKIELDVGLTGDPRNFYVKRGDRSGMVYESVIRPDGKVDVAVSKHVKSIDKAFASHPTLNETIANAPKQAQDGKREPPSVGSEFSIAGAKVKVVEKRDGFVYLERTEATPKRFPIYATTKLIPEADLATKFEKIEIGGEVCYVDRSGGSAVFAIKRKIDDGISPKQTELYEAPELCRIAESTLAKIAVSEPIQGNKPKPRGGDGVSPVKPGGTASGSPLKVGDKVEVGTFKCTVTEAGNGMFELEVSNAPPIESTVKSYTKQEFESKFQPINRPRSVFGSEEKIYRCVSKSGETPFVYLVSQVGDKFELCQLPVMRIPAEKVNDLVTKRAESTVVAETTSSKALDAVIEMVSRGNLSPAEIRMFELEAEKLEAKGETAKAKALRDFAKDLKGVNGPQAKAATEAGVLRELRAMSGTTKAGILGTGILIGAALEYFAHKTRQSGSEPTKK